MSAGYTPEQVRARYDEFVESVTSGGDLALVTSKEDVLVWSVIQSIERNSRGAKALAGELLRGRAALLEARRKRVW